MATLLRLIFSVIGLVIVGGVKNCHPQCRCEVESYGLFDSFSLTKVDCSEMGPVTAPVPIPLDTSHLDLSLNSITTITDSMLSGPGYTTLVSLDLSNNLIGHVDPKAFLKLRYLETLDLSRNFLESLSDGCFAGLPLVEVDLSENRFQDFSLDLFTTRGQDIPIMVDLSKNLLTSISSKTPGHPLYIKSLMLAGNRLRSVPVLTGVPLQYLNLDGNLISSIDTGAFESLTELVHLSISSMPELTEVQSGAFRGLRNLQFLDLTNNGQLKTLSPEVFSGLASLQELNLSNTAVTPISQTVFTQMPSIKSITVGQNVHCWRTQKQEQLYRQTGRATASNTLSCDVPGMIL